MKRILFLKKESDDHLLCDVTVCYTDEGVEMVVAYHGVISTVRLQGKCAWDFLGEFFKNIFNGCKDFVNLIPQNIKLVCTNS